MLPLAWLHSAPAKIRFVEAKAGLRSCQPDRGFRQLEPVERDPNGAGFCRAVLGDNSRHEKLAGLESKLLPCEAKVLRIGVDDFESRDAKLPGGAQAALARGIRARGSTGRQLQLRADGPAVEKVPESQERTARREDRAQDPRYEGSHRSPAAPR